MGAATEDRKMGILVRSSVCACLLLAGCTAFAQDGAEVFRNNCSTCHRDGSPTQAPLPEALRRLPRDIILAALETGKMRPQGALLNPVERGVVAQYLGSAASPEVMPPSAHCSGTAKPANLAASWSGWGSDAGNTRFQTAKAGGLSRGAVPRLKLKWAFGFPGVSTAFATPTVSGGKVFVGSADGTVYSLNAQSGCIYWTFKATEGVRTAVVLGPTGKAAYFGDLQGNMYAVNASTGALLWKTRVDDHLYAEITGSPKLEAGRLYVPVSGGAEQVAAGSPSYVCCTFRGSLVALDAETGKQIWKSFTIAEPAQQTGRTAAGSAKWGPSGVALWSSPTIDVARQEIYVSTGVNYSDPPSPNSDAVLAFAMDSGRLLWSKQLLPDDVFNFGCVTPTPANCPETKGKDFDLGTPPLLRPLAGGQSLLLVGAKSGVLYALDPRKQGAIVWQSRIGSGGPQGGIMWGNAADDKRVYVARSDWDPGKPDAGGGMYGLDIATGKTVWTTPAPKPACLGTQGCSAAQLGPVSAIPGVVFAGSLDGHLRAYDGAAGGILWDFDTLREFPTVNGIKARGGSMNGSGPSIAGGMVFSNSGYSRIPVMAGNLLLAFSVDGK
jgi:polyvinyl alcohol dehydrogenase (cytochrome)